MSAPHRPDLESSADKSRGTGSEAELLGERLERVARSRGSAVAVVDGAQRLTYEDFLGRADALAKALQDRGVGPGDLVGILLPRSADLVVAVAGVVRAGAAYLPIDRSHPAERRSLILSDAEPRIVVTDAANLHAIPAGLPTLLFSAATARPDLSAAPPRPGLSAAPARPGGGLTRPSRDDPAYVIYTSGSTGTPNGVRVSQHNAARLFTATEPLFGFGPDDVWTLFHSIAFDFSVWEMWGALLHGGRLVVVSSSTARAADSFHELVLREGVTVLNQTPSAFRAFDAADAAAGRPRSRLRHVVFGGEALDPRTLKGWFRAHGDEQPRLVNMYGITETTVHVTFRRMSLEDALGDGKSLVGSPLPDLRVDLLDPEGRPVADGQVGEIFVAGLGVSLGYLRRPELTAQRFLPDPRGAGPDSRRYRSGDLGRRLPNGELEYLGRSDLQVKIRGFRIEPGEIEAALRDAPGVVDAVVTRFEDPATGPRLVAYVVPEREAPLDAPALRRHLELRLPESMVPAVYVRIERVPRTVNDKVDRDALPPPTADALPRADSSEAPRDDVEKEVARVFSDVLGASVTTRDADFFRLGGHSLLAVRAAILCRQRLDVELTANALFARPTVAALAEEVRREREQGRKSGTIRRVPRRGGTPLTPHQQALWLDQKLRADEDAYNEPVAMRLPGRVDPVRLRRALQKLAERHEVLRARLIEPEEGPRLVFDRDASSVELHVRVDADLREIAYRPFDLRAGPLWRCVLQDDGRDGSVLALVVHHLILDADAQATLLRELASFYDDPESALRLRDRDFADLAVHESERLASARAELQRFWSGAFEGAQPTPSLPPPCLPSPSGEEDEGCLSHRAIDADLSRKIRELAASWGTTPFHVHLTAFLALLRTYAAAEDLVVGSPVSLRDRPEAEGVVGYLLSPSALRVRLAGDRSFRESVEETARRWQDVRAHARLPLHQAIQAASGPRRGHAASPVQVFFSWIQDPLEGLRFDGLLVEPVRLAPAHAKFKLFLLVEERSDGATMLLTFPRGALDPEMGDRLLGHLEELLRSAVLDPGARISEMSLAGAREEETLAAWGSHPAPFPRDRSVAGLFEEIARERPRATALVEGMARVTYEALDRRANAVAQALRAAGVDRGDRVPLLLARGIRFVACALGVLKSGAAYVPLDPTSPMERHRRLLDEIGARVGLRWSDSQSSLGAIRWLDAKIADEESASAAAKSAERPESPAYVMFTSGSTGRPKGVEVPQRAVVRLVRGQDFARMGAGEIWLQMAPTNFDASTLEIWAPLLNGGTCVVLEEAVPTPVLLEQTIRREKVTSAWITASLFNALIDEAPSCLSGLSQILVGGEALSPPHVRRALDHLPDVQLINGYGPTENTTFTSCHTIRPEDVGAGRSVPIGRPIANTTVRVWDADGRPAPIGVPGELVAGGDGIALGYVGQPEIAAERFPPDPDPARPGARLYRTGDRVRWRPDGLLEFFGRVDDQVKIRGYRVEPGEVAACLSEHEAVRQAVVMPRSFASGATQLVACVVPKREAAGSDLTHALLKHVGERLPAHMVPSSFLLLGEIPLTANGKVDLTALKTVTQEHSVARREVPPSSIEARVLAIWREVLENGALGLDEDFFEAGGDSLLAVRMLSRLEREFGRGIPARYMTEASTARRLAAVLGSPISPRSAYPAGVVVMRPGDADRPLFCLPGLGSVAFRLRALARKLHTRREILAVELHDLSVAPSVLESLSDTAEAVVHCMRQVQPVGPYAFLGYSYGGNLAVEVARLLLRANEAVELVVVLDAYAPGSLRNPGPIRKVARHLRILKRMTGREAYDYVSSKISQRIGLRPGDLSEEDAFLASPESEIERRLAETSARCIRAFDAYRPEPFPGRIVLVHATDLGDWMEVGDPSGTCGWGAICTKGVDIVTIQCRHLDLLKEPHLTDLSQHVDGLLGAQPVP